MFDTDKAVLNRRAMLAGLGAGAGALSFISASEAQTSSLPQPEASTEYDVVVIGSGMAGCAAALEAALAGKHVVILEKASSTGMGGNSSLAGGYFALPDEDSADARQGFVEDFDTFCQKRGNVAIFETMAANALADVE